jgi:hypothetical protein
VYSSPTEQNKSKKNRLVSAGGKQCDVREGAEVGALGHHRPWWEVETLP